jgi:hypothetical protein
MPEAAPRKHSGDDAASSAHALAGIVSPSGYASSLASNVASPSVNEDSSAVAAAAHPRMVRIHPSPTGNLHRTVGESEQDTAHQLIEMHRQAFGQSFPQPDADALREALRDAINGLPDREPDQDEPESDEDEDEKHDSYNDDDGPATRHFTWQRQDIDPCGGDSDPSAQQIPPDLQKWSGNQPEIHDVIIQPFQPQPQQQSAYSAHLEQLLQQQAMMQQHPYQYAGYPHQLAPPTLNGTYQSYYGGGSGGYDPSLDYVYEDDEPTHDEDEDDDYEHHLDPTLYQEETMPFSERIRRRCTPSIPTQQMMWKAMWRMYVRSRMAFGGFSFF